MLNRLRALRGPGESYSEGILRIAKSGAWTGFRWITSRDGLCFGILNLVNSIKPTFSDGP